MSSVIANATLNAWTTSRKTRTSSKGWVSGNACCCAHNGESVDKRGRGGLILGADGAVSYACFNCAFKTGYVPGYPLSYKFRKLLSWMGVDDLEIHRLAIEALREKERQELLGIIKPEEKKEELKVNFKKYPLPDEAVSFFGLIEFYELKGSVDYPAGFIHAVEYVAKRRIDMQQYDFYWSANTKLQMNRRVIVPFTWKNEIIGYSARALTDAVKPKYQSQIDDGYVFNIDRQERDWKFVIVAEGVFDALAIDGVAVLKSDITKQQIDIIESLDREIIVVPDQNKSGIRLIDAAIANGWSVSFPVWAETCEDISQAVEKYGKLFVMKTILDSVERSKLKIALKRKKFK